MNEEKEENKQIGRTKISSLHRKNVSHRAIKNNIAVIKKKCPYCNHHKAIETYFSGKIKCSRCKRS